MAPVIKQLRRHSQLCNSLVCVTGQHRQMLDEALALFDIQPDYDLNIMQPNQSLSGLTAALFQGLDIVIGKSSPDWILAQGDTTSVLVASLVAFYHRRRFGHVEAGLRTGNKYSPFPEELNRRVADMVADVFFCPTERSRQTLLMEGCNPRDILVTGNTVVDALKEIAARPIDWGNSRLSNLTQTEDRLVLVTAHRRESFGVLFRTLCEAIRELAVKYLDQHVYFVYPVHLNPNVQRPVHSILGGLPNVKLTEPVDYLTMVHLMKRASLILTDSGGIQEEAPTFGIPVLVMRETTERPEGVESGVARLVGTSRKSIVLEATRILECQAAP